MHYTTCTRLEDRGHGNKEEDGQRTSRHMDHEWHAPALCGGVPTGVPSTLFQALHCDTKAHTLKLGLEPPLL